MGKLKTIIAKYLTFESSLGEHLFLNVPILVESDVDPESFNPENDDYALSEDVIETMSRKLAKKWLHGYLNIDQDGNHIRRYQLTATEIQGIMLTCGIRPVDLGNILQISPAQVSKVLNEVDSQKLQPLAVRFLLYVLRGELAEKGFAVRVLEHKELSVRQSESDFDLKRA
jgi:hypothetical protein